MSQDKSAHQLSKTNLILLGLAVPLSVASFSLIFGLGMIRRISMEWNVFLALLIVIVPPISLSLNSPFKRDFLGLGYCIWTLLIVYCFPMYFPQERESAFRIGFSLFSFDEFASDIDRILPKAPNGRKPLLMAEPAKLVHRSDNEKIDDPDVIYLPFEGEGASMTIPISIGNSEYGEELWMLFDTGASLTTLDHETLEYLGIDIPINAPVITMQTANGEREGQLVLVDDLWIAGVELGTVTIVTCDACSDRNKVGLLGLNISSRFLVTVDSHKKELLLKQRPDSEIDLTPEIRPWLGISGEAIHWPGGRIEVKLTIDNIAKRPVSEVEVEIRCRESYFSIVKNIAKESSRTTEVVLPDEAKCDVYALGLKKARWN